MPAAVYDIYSERKLRRVFINENCVYFVLAAATKIVLGNEVGPQLEHIFLVENFGSVDLHDIVFQLDIPIRTDEGDTLLYLADKARLLDDNASGKLHLLFSHFHTTFFTILIHLF